MSNPQTDLAGSVPARHWYTRQHAWLVGGIVFVAAVVGGVYYVRFAQGQEAARPGSASAADNEANEAGGPESAYRALKATEQQTPDPAQKVQLYGELAAAASSTGNLTEALEYYKKRHQLDPSTKMPDAYLVGTIHEQLDAVPQAIEYYRLAAEYYKSLPQSQQVRADLSGLEGHLQELESR